MALVKLRAAVGFAHGTQVIQAQYIITGLVLQDQP
jgi:hypothetical protein